MASAILGGDRRLARRRWIIVLFIFSFIAILLAAMSRYHLQRRRDIAFPLPGQGLGHSKFIEFKEFVKPNNITVVGLVFFGRKNRVEMLRCYLERNLVDNGGWLDEVHWVQNTKKEHDLAYLEEILASSPRYKKIDLSSEGVGFVGYANAWGHLERGKLYVKIDDDVVWFADDAIPRVVAMKINHPEFLLVSANIINSPLMGWVQYHMGAMHPYLPEFGVSDAPESATFDFSHLLSNRKSWRYTDYPYWEGPDDWFWEAVQKPPSNGHRWLRLEDDSAIHRTPVSEIEYETWGIGLKSWAIAAQQHYSFLENLARNRLDIYKFGKAWITDYTRLSINFITIWADDVLDNLPMDTVDEEWLTVKLPEQLRRNIAVESDALAAHFSFGTQGGVDKTDLLARYHDYALENACQRAF